MTDYTKLEQDLGYTFVDKKLLETAFTHTTYVFETGRGHWESNQRLEFIGDAARNIRTKGSNGNRKSQQQ